MRYKGDHKQYAIAKKVPWKYLSEERDNLAQLFNEQVKEVFPNVITSIRTYRSSSKCRFVVVFRDWQKDPDEVNAQIEDIINTTLEIFITHKNTKKYA